MDQRQRGDEQVLEREEVNTKGRDEKLQSEVAFSNAMSRCVETSLFQGETQMTAVTGNEIVAACEDSES